MDLTERSRRELEGVLDRLEREYRTFEPIEKTWTHPPAGYRSIVDRFEEGAVGGAGVWVRNEAGEVLLVRNEGDEGWADPGGKREAGETFEEAAVREVREETGIECRLTGLCEAHAIEHRPAEGDDPPVFSAITIFFGERVDGTPRPREGEIADVDWFASPPETVLYEEVRERPYPETE